MWQGKGSLNRKSELRSQRITRSAGFHGNANPRHNSAHATPQTNAHYENNELVNGTKKQKRKSGRNECVCFDLLKFKNWSNI